MACLVISTQATFRAYKVTLCGVKEASVFPCVLQILRLPEFSI